MNPRERGWYKSSFSDDGAGCVEVRFINGEAQVRDSKDTAGSVLVFNRGEWDAFLLGAFSGEFEMPL